MNKILKLIYILIILYYTKGSACTTYTLYNDDKSYSKLSVDNEKTQVCIKNPSSFGYKQIASCTQATYVDSYEKCSRLSVSSSKINTHVCIKNPDKSKNNCIESNICSQIEYGATSEICSKMSVSKDNYICEKSPSKVNTILCEKFLKQKYGLSNEEELILIKDDKISNFTEGKIDFAFFSTSLGSFFPWDDCIKNITTYNVGCKEFDCQNSNLNSNKCIKVTVPTNNIDNELQSDCTKLENGATDEICSKLSVSKDKINTHVCIKDTPKLNMALCEKFIKKKYGLSDKKELITVQGDREGDYILFSTSLGAFLPINLCYNDVTIYTSKCKEENI